MKILLLSNLVRLNVQQISWRGRRSPLSKGGMEALLFKPCSTEAAIN
ncbi:MAG: hypothetical protein V7K72_17675 [Nostoc sp.]